MGISRVTGSTPFLTLAMALWQWQWRWRWRWLYGKLGSFLKIKTKVLKKLHAVRAVNGATHFPKDSVEPNVGGSLAEMLTKRPVLLLGGLELAPRPGTFAVLDFQEMDVPLIAYELTRVPDPGQRLVGWCWC